jgi:hypothetical protein
MMHVMVRIRLPLQGLSDRVQRPTIVAGAGLQTSLFAHTNPSAPALSSPTPPKLWQSIALRLGGFSASITALLGPLRETRSPQVVRAWFEQRLPELASLAARSPGEAHRVIREQLRAIDPLTRELVRVAAGDGSALASALEIIEHTPHTMLETMTEQVLAAARLRPAEGRYLIRHLFHHADLTLRLQMIRSLAGESGPGQSKLVGELFLALMEGASTLERREVIYPALSELLAAAPEERMPARGFLSALYRGWLSECTDLPQRV